MKVLLTGASGLVGSALRPVLQVAGHRVIPARRGTPGNGEAQWDPVSGAVRLPQDTKPAAVIHLAGAGIADGRWSTARKAAIRDSRVAPTARLCEWITRQDPLPHTLLCASAIGIYGDRGEAELRESSDPGEGFLVDVCQAWEDATAAARNAGVRVVNLRIGVVLSPSGGALAKMLTPFRMGAGGRIGTGRQYMSWISIDDAVGAIRFALEHEAVEGPVNVVAPAPVTNETFSRALSQVLRRPCIMPLPAVIARALLGEMADALLLSGARVLPGKLAETGYIFQHAELADALRHVLDQEKETR